MLVLVTGGDDTIMMMINIPRESSQTCASVTSACVCEVVRVIVCLCNHLEAVEVHAGGAGGGGDLRVLHPNTWCVHVCVRKCVVQRTPQTNARTHTHRPCAMALNV